MNPLRPAIRATTSLRTVSFPKTPYPSIRRPLTSPIRRGFATQREADFRNKVAVGPFTWKAASIFLGTGVCLFFYFVNEKEKVVQRRREELENKTVGRPNIGGPFQLLDTNNQPFTEQDLRGKWTLIYFGFTHCPDICPEELDKMGAAVELIDKDQQVARGDGKGEVLPVFVSVDPARDSVAQVKKYVADFHPRLIGLTGDYDSVKRACKSYRVYFSTPPDAKPGDDYLVDHSIFFYLMDPLGQFVDAFGKNTSAAEVAEKTRIAMGKWEKAGGNAVAGV